MLKKIIIGTLVFCITIIFSSCYDNPAGSSHTDTIQSYKFTGTVITYTLISEIRGGGFKNDIHIIENNADTKLFPNDTTSRGYCSVSPSGKKLIYQKGFAVGIWGYSTGTKPTICISNDKGQSEVIFNLDSSATYYYPTWISDSLVFMVKRKDNLTYLAFYDTLAHLIIEKQTSHYFTPYLIPGTRYLYCSGGEGFSIYNLNDNSLVEVNDSFRVADYVRPSYYNNSLFITLYNSKNGNNHLIYDIASKTYSYYNFGEDSIYIIYRDSNYFIGGRLNSNYALLFNNNKAHIDSAQYTLSSTIYLEWFYPFFRNNICYFSESPPGTKTAFNVFKVNFSDNTITQISNNPPYHIIDNLNVQYID